MFGKENSMQSLKLNGIVTNWLCFFNLLRIQKSSFPFILLVVCYDCITRILMQHNENIGPATDNKVLIYIDYSW